MGDRANFGMRQFTGHTIYLYGHSEGYQMLSKMANALSRVSKAGRLDDDAYGTRIFIEEMTKKDFGRDSGWGITVDHLADNEHKIPVYDFETQTVSLHGDIFNDYEELQFGEALFSMPVADFIKKYGDLNGPA